MEQTAETAGETPARQARAGNGGVVPPLEHRFKPGQSGCPGGGWVGIEPPGPALRRAWDKLMKSDPGRADRIVAALAEQAEAGDVRAISLAWDREEGKPKQAIEHSGEIVQQTRVVVRGSAVEQVVARQTHNLEAVGSTPTRATNGEKV